jgi:hypothetical protein
VCAPLVVLGAAGAGVWTAYGRPGGPLERVLGLVAPRGVRRLILRPRARLGVAARAAAAGAAVLVGGGALLLAPSLVWHGGTAQGSFLQLTEGWSGRFAVLLLCVALVPNAAVWAAAYALGPGFLLGTDHLVTPIASAPAPLLPPFPLLAAVPEAGAGTPVNWVAGVVPVVAGVVAGWFVGRDGRFVAGDERVSESRPSGDRGSDGRDVAWSWWRTAGAAGLAAVLCAVVLAVLAAVAGGPLGRAVLARFGPVWWQVGGATLAWVGVLAVPTALGVRALRCWRSGERRMRIGRQRGETPEAGRSGGRRFRVALPAMGGWFSRGKRAEGGAPTRPAAPDMPQYVPIYDQDTAYGFEDVDTTYRLEGHDATYGLRDRDDALFEPYDFLSTDPPDAPSDGTRR